ncbi:unnamed protein product [Tenebrio molitor]|jgi:hypothetical protein|nr:unnamed protein product [Tenebrio molitor]
MILIVVLVAVCEEDPAAATMKSPPAVPDDCDDIFGPPRTYPTGYCPPKNRPSMISAKYRQKEERRKVLKISLNKLKKIEDPESSLCRSVLINNTMKRLQREARDEKIQKQQLNYPRCYDNDNILNIKSEFIKNESKSSFEESQVDFAVENDFDAKLAEEIVTAKNMEVFNELVEGNLSLEPSFAGANVVQEASRKRSFDDMEDCDVQDVLKQFYMPPTPRMLTCIDEDEEGAEAAPKRAKVEEADAECDKNGDYSVNSFINNNIPSERLRYASQGETDSSSFSCGQASLFNELQNNVYHNLIASLET